MSTKSHIITSLCGVRVNVVVEQDPDGQAFALYETLTSCCDAAVTGTVDGLVCRGCYERVEEHLVGGGVHVYEAAARAKGCPIPRNCASHIEWTADFIAEQLIESFAA